MPAVKSQLAVQSNLQDSAYDCSSALRHCYVTLSGARSTAGEMCRNFPPESELKLFACGGSRNLHSAQTHNLLSTLHTCAQVHTSKVTKLLNEYWPVPRAYLDPQAFLGLGDTSRSSQSVRSNATYPQMTGKECRQWENKKLHESPRNCH